MKIVLIPLQTKADPRRSVSGEARICVIRGEAPSSTVSTTEHTEAASRHTEDTEPQPPAPLFTPVPISLGESGLVKKPGQGRLDAFQCAWAVSSAARASHGNADLDGQVMEFDRQVMGKNRECVRFCFIVFCFITVPEVAEIGLRRIQRGPQLLDASRHAPRRLSRLLRSGISSRGGTAPRDGVREHVRGALPGRRRRAPRAARVLRAPGPFGRHAPTLKDNLHVSARSVLTGRRTPPPSASTSFNTMERRRASPTLTAQGP